MIRLNSLGNLSYRVRTFARPDTSGTKTVFPKGTSTVAYPQIIFGNSGNYYGAFNAQMSDGTFNFYVCTPPGTITDQIAWFNSINSTAQSGIAAPCKGIVWNCRDMINVWDAYRAADYSAWASIH